MTGNPGSSPDSPPDWGNMGVGLGTVLLAAIVGWQTFEIPGGAIYAQVGPNVIPWAVTVMLAVFGLALTAEAWLGRLPVPEEAHGAIDRSGLSWMLLGLALNLALIDYAGFILASTAMFICTARAFESRNTLRDAGIGFAVALVAYVGFDRVLGYKIGSGLIEGLI